MKICLLTPEFLPRWGGIGTYTYNLARGLRDRGEVHVLTMDRWDETADGADVDGVQIHSVGANGATSSRPSTSRFQLAVLRELPKLVRAHGFDIVHANHAYMSDLLARLRKSRASSVLTVHTTLDAQVAGTRRAEAKVPRHPIERGISRWRPLLRLVERHYLERSPNIIFVSRWIRDHTLRGYRISPRLSAVVQNAVDVRRFSPRETGSAAQAKGPADSPHILLFAGRLLALKGVDTVFRALALLPRDVRLWLAGPGDAARWARYARALGLSEARYSFLGPVPHVRMPSLYRLADAVVVPSFAESCPMVALEAMACGAPLVAARTGGISELVQDDVTGWLFEAGNAEALAERLETVLSEPTRTAEVQANAASWAEFHASLGRMADETFRFYEKVLQGHAS